MRVSLQITTWPMVLACRAVGGAAARKLAHTLDSFVEIVLATSARPAGGHSVGGEAQRTRWSAILGSSLTDVHLRFDDPTIGLHPHDIQRRTALLLQAAVQRHTCSSLSTSPETSRSATTWSTSPRRRCGGAAPSLRGHGQGCGARGNVTGRHFDDRPSSRKCCARRRRVESAAASRTTCAEKKTHNKKNKTTKTAKPKKKKLTKKNTKNKQTNKKQNKKTKQQKPPPKTNVLNIKKQTKQKNEKPKTPINTHPPTKILRRLHPSRFLAFFTTFFRLLRQELADPLFCVVAEVWCRSIMARSAGSRRINPATYTGLLTDP